MCPVTTTNSLPVVFGACSVRARPPPAGLSPPPRESVSICLASPAMTQHWPTTEHTHTLMHRHTLPLAVSLGPVSVPRVFLFLFILSPLSGMRNARCDRILASLYFYLNWGPQGEQKEAKTALLFFLRCYPGTLTLSWCLVAALWFCGTTFSWRSNDIGKSKQTGKHSIRTWVNASAFFPFFHPHLPLMSFMPFKVIWHLKHHEEPMKLCMEQLMDKLPNT